MNAIVILSNRPVLVDADVLMWHLRGYAQVTRRLDQLDSRVLSSVSYLELLQGMRSKAELAALKKMLERRMATLLTISEPITQRAPALMELLTLSHGLQLGDALIAATALEHGLVVLTANVKRFSAVPGLTLDAFAPG